VNVAGTPNINLGGTSLPLLAIFAPASYSVSGSGYEPVGRILPSGPVLTLDDPAVPSPPSSPGLGPASAPDGSSCEDTVTSLTPLTASSLKSTLTFRRGSNSEVDCNDCLRELVLAGALCNDAVLSERDGEWVLQGDPTGQRICSTGCGRGMTATIPLPAHRLPVWGRGWGRREGRDGTGSSNPREKGSKHMHNGQVDTRSAILAKTSFTTPSGVRDWWDAPWARLGRNTVVIGLNGRTACPIIP